MHFIGIDIGTSSVCGVVYDLATGQTETVTRENSTNLAPSQPWESIQDAARIVTLAREVVDECRAKHPDVKGIGVTGQMHGIVYIDGEGNAVSPLYTWQDRRGNLLYRGAQTYAEYLSTKTGCQVATGYGLVTHFYNLKNGLVPAGAVRVCTIMDYVVMKLAGRKTPLMDYTNAAGLGFFALQSLRFDREALKKIDICPSILPETAPSAQLVGNYKDTVPVYSAIGDNQASFLGAVREKDCSVLATIGTSSQVSVYSEKFVEVDSLDTRPFPGGGYILVGAALCGGRSLALLNAFFRETLRLFGGNVPDKVDVYNIMASVAYDSDDRDLPLVKTLFDGQRFAPWETGSISNLSTTNLTPQNLILGFLQGISRELADFYRLIPGPVRQNKTLLVGSGNAVKKNPLLCQMLEEQFGLPFSLSLCREEAAFGACLCAIMGGGYNINS